MRADLSRDTFDPTNHFLRVLIQQGRVEVDADPNEQASILLHYLHALAADLIGPWGGPDGGFEIGVNGNDLSIGAGHYYVDGILCELEQPSGGRDGGGEAQAAVSYLNQPDYPHLEGDELSQTPFLVYLDVWERLITALDDQGIREVALGGPDTAARTRVVWQVKTETSRGLPARAAGDREIQGVIWKEFPAFVQAWQPQDRGTLAARAGDPPDDSGPCITPPSAGYRGPENQLYRVEIVKSGAVDEAEYVWSRENGSVVSAWDQSQDRLTVANAPRDSHHGYEAGQWVEFTDDTHELRDEPRVFAQLTQVDEAVLSVDPADVPASADYPLHPKIRRWDSDGPQTVQVPAPDSWIALEDGIEIQFGSTGYYRRGDYWLIPARVLGGIEWPATDQPRPPDGVTHHYAPLAVVYPGDPNPVVDLRRQLTRVAQ